MKRVLYIFSNLNNCFLHKFISCVILFCIVLGLIQTVPIKYDNSLLQSAKVSANTVISHFFSLSSFTMDTVSKLFVETEQLSTDTVKQHKKENKTKDSTASKQASAYSILPSGTLYSFIFNRTLNKVKSNTSVVANISSIKYLHSNVINKYKEFVFLNIMMFIIMMFLIKKNTSSDNYCNIKLNKNISIAWLI